VVEILFTNNATTTLALPVSVGQTSVNLAAGAGALFPSPTGGDFFTLTLTNSGGTLREITFCTARTGDTVTLTRGQEGTTALAWNAGDLAQNLLTARTIHEIFTEQVGGVLSGRLPNPSMAVGAAAGNLGPAGGHLTGTYPNPTFNHGVGHTWTVPQGYSASIILGNNVTIQSYDAGGVLRNMIHWSVDNFHNNLGAQNGWRVLNMAGNTANLTVDDSGNTGVRGNLAVAGVINANGAITNQSGNITAFSGKLRASYGSGGDANAATLLNEFQYQNANYGFLKLPSGFILQWMPLGVSFNQYAGADTWFNFPIAFPSGCVTALISFMGSSPPFYDSNAGISVELYNNATAIAHAGKSTYSGTYGCVVWAIGW
jgi:hypothetical protein